MIQKKVNIQNKKARFEYQILDTYTAGMVLNGSEIKSIRMSKASITEAYCYFNREELFIKGMTVSEYRFASFGKPQPTRERKLLLNKRELAKIQKHATTKGNTIVPLRLFISEKGWAKLEIGLATGKKLYDKREDLKTKDVKRDLDRVRKSFN